MDAAVCTPEDMPYLAPTGWYMLFLLAEDGACSECVWVRSQPEGFGNRYGTYNAKTPTSEASVIQAVCSSSTVFHACTYVGREQDYSTMVQFCHCRLPVCTD